MREKGGRFAGSGASVAVGWGCRSVWIGGEVVLVDGLWSLKLCLGGILVAVWGVEFL